MQPEIEYTMRFLMLRNSWAQRGGLLSCPSEFPSMFRLATFRELRITSLERTKAKCCSAAKKWLAFGAVKRSDTEKRVLPLRVGQRLRYCFHREMKHD